MNLAKKGSYRLSAIILFIYWGFQMAMKGFAIESSFTVYRIGIFVIIPFAVIKFLTDKYTKRDILIFAMLLYLAYRCYLSTGSIEVLILIVTITLFRNVEIENVMNWAYKIRGLSFGIHIILALMGVMDIGKMYVASQDRWRYCFGFSHPNLAQAEFFQIVVYYLLAKKGKIQPQNYLIIVALDVFLFHFTDSRTGLTAVLLLLLFNIAQRSSCYRKCVKYIGKYVFVFFAVLCVLFSKYYYVLSFLQGKGTFSSRYQTSYYMMRLSKVKLFGDAVAYSTDLGYVNFLFGEGIIIFMIFIVTHTLLIKKSIYQNKWYVVAYLLTFAIYFILEHYGQSVLYDVAWLYTGEIIFKKSKKETLSYQWTGRKYAENAKV